MLLSLYQGRKKHFITAHRYYDIGSVSSPDYGSWQARNLNYNVNNKM